MSKIALPKGFQPISGGGKFAPSHDFKKNKSVTGKLISIRKVTFDKGKKNERTVQVAELETGKNQRVSVWESAGTRPLFAVKKGTRVFVQYIGLKKLPGRKQPMRDFVVATET